MFFPLHQSGVKTQRKFTLFSSLFLSYYSQTVRQYNRPMPLEIQKDANDNLAELKGPFQLSKKMLSKKDKRALQGAELHMS